MNKRVILGISLLLFFATTISNAQTLSHKKSLEYTKEKIAERSRMYDAKYSKEWDSKVLTNGSHKMKFSYEIFGDMPVDGRALYISMHGGGGAPEAVNTQQWNNQKKLYTPSEGLYFVPRAPTDTWNMWHQGYMDGFIEKIITLAIIKEGVNPNKVYIMGYSAGGDGTYQLAPRLADLWAGAAMSAGHPGDAKIENLMNLPFAIYMGGDDAAYQRNEIAVDWGNWLKELSERNKGKYINSVNVYEKHGHWMKSRDTVSMSWLPKFTRNPIPNKVHWIQDDVIRDNFYWLEATESGKNKRAEIIASYTTDREIYIDECTPKSIVIKLNDDMMNLNKPITVYFKGKQIFKGNVKRTKKNIEDDVNNLRDENLIFPSRILVNIEEGSVTVIK